ncbi:polysaccharide deacetylase [uncultured Winogradskyella sp.]|uniref:polysaccharide deacetylase n=1 Tax=uncultured Winogradskyella sp. TaxID=395353 RepID=UPI0030ED6333|tara:strand:- start:728 stop:1708 length:981 start_codon:yes stop_codon:yes gene_type:complete
MKNGKFVISLDFETHWGFFDNKSLDNCRSQLLNTELVINRLLEESQQHNLSITFATVGMLFAKDKTDITRYIPEIKPKYNNIALDAYELLDNISDKDNSIYFTQDLVKKIDKDPLHEVGTHTFCHYYCYEKGQSAEDFKADLTSAIMIANDLNIATKSIVFPRNQVQNSYLDICANLGIETYRGNCWFNFNFASKKSIFKEFGLVALPVFDTYFNISGSNSFKLEDFNSKNATIINIPASRFLRPFNPKLKMIESLKINRIKRAMTKAAKRNEVYHLWWHPHNFANNIEENFNNFLKIVKHYNELKNKYNFESITMEKLGKNFKES